MTGRCRVKKAVVGMTELIAALFPIHGMLVFLAINTAFLILLEKCTGSLSITIALVVFDELLL